MSRELTRRGLLVSAGPALSMAALPTTAAASDGSPHGVRSPPTQISEAGRTYTDGRVTTVHSSTAVDGDFVVLATTAAVKYVPGEAWLFGVDGDTGERTWSRRPETVVAPDRSALAADGADGFLAATNPTTDSDLRRRIDLVRMDADGASRWRESYRLDGHDATRTTDGPTSGTETRAAPTTDGPGLELVVRDVAAAADGYVIAALRYAPPEVYEPTLLRVDADGVERGRYRPFPDSLIYPGSVSIADDGGYLLSGFELAFGRDAGGARTGLLARIGPDGDVDWRRDFVVPVREASTLHGALYDHASLEDGYALAGFASARDGSDSAGWILRTDREGRRQDDWVLASERPTRFRSVASHDGTIYATGYADPDPLDDRFSALLAGVDPADGRLWDTTLVDRLTDSVPEIAITSDGTFGVSGTVEATADDTVSGAWLAAVGRGETPTPTAIPRRTETPTVTPTPATTETANGESTAAGPEPPTDESTTAETGAGFGAASALAALGGLLWRRRDRTDDDLER